MPQPNDDEGAHPWRTEDAELEQLLEQSRLGNVDAFEALYDRTAVYLLAEVRLVMQVGQVDDVLAEIYLQVWNTVHTHERRRRPASDWLRSIARSRALVHYLTCTPTHGVPPEQRRPEQLSVAGPDC